MLHFKIALGYKTEHRNSEPVILAAGFNAAALQGAIDAAPAEFLRFEIGVFQFTRKGRRTVPAPAPTETREDLFVGPTVDDMQAAVFRIGELEKLLEAANAENARLAAASTPVPPSTPSAIVAPETPAPEAGIDASGAESGGGESAEDEGGPKLPADPSAPSRRKR